MAMRAAGARSERVARSLARSPVCPLACGCCYGRRATRPAAVESRGARAHKASTVALSARRLKSDARGVAWRAETRRGVDCERQSRARTSRMILQRRISSRWRIERLWCRTILFGLPFARSRCCKDVGRRVAKFCAFLLARCRLLTAIIRFCSSWRRNDAAAVSAATASAARRAVFGDGRSQMARRRHDNPRLSPARSSCDERRRASSC